MPRVRRPPVFVLHGEGTPRRYAMIHTGDNWLLHLTRDQPEGLART